MSAMEAVLPPIVVQTLQRMMDKKEPLHVRQNAAGVIDDIIRVCQPLLTKFRNETQR